MSWSADQAGISVSDARELRRKAALCRRAAGIRTEGGSRTDRRLLELAEELEREADALEGRGPNENRR
jgi:hypothetical protein